MKKLSSVLAEHFSEFAPVIAGIMTACAIASVVAFTYTPPSGIITLRWDYTDSPPELFKVYATTNVGLPWTNWPYLTNVPGTSTDEVTNWTTTNLSFKIQPGMMFFFVTASNFWRESGPSNITNTPAVAGWPANLRISRTN